MAPVPGCRCIGFSVGPVTPTVINPSELNEGAYICRSEGEGGWRDVGCVVYIRFENDRPMAYILCDENDHFYMWDGSTFVVNSDVPMGDAIAAIYDFINGVYQDTYGSIEVTYESTTELPSSLLAIILF